MFCEPTCDLSWRNFQVYMKKMCILLFLDEMSHRYQVNPSDLLCHLRQGSPTPGPWTCLGCGLLGTGLHSRRWAVDKWVKLHLYLQLLPISHITAWVLPPVRSVAALDSHRTVNPAVNCTCKGSRLCPPYENLMPNDLRWNWGSGASTGEGLQIKIIISSEVLLHRDHNKSIDCRLISKPFQWVASDN